MVNMCTKKSAKNIWVQFASPRQLELTILHCWVFNMTGFAINEILLFDFRTKPPYVMSETADTRTARYPWVLGVST